MVRYNTIGWHNFYPVFLSMELYKGFRSFSMLAKIVDKTTLLNSISKFSSGFLVFFIYFACETKNTSVFEYIFVLRKAAIKDLFRNVFL